MHTEEPEEGQVMYLGLLQSIDRCLQGAGEGYEFAISHIERMAEVMDNELGEEILSSITERGGYGILVERFEQKFRLELAATHGWVAAFEGFEYPGNPYQGSEEEREQWANGYRNAIAMMSK